MSEGQGGRNQADLANFIDHNKQFYLLIRAKPLEHKCDIINLPFLKDHSDIYVNTALEGGSSRSKETGQKTLARRERWWW